MKVQVAVLERFGEPLEVQEVGLADVNRSSDLMHAQHDIRSVILSS